jgi:hypothetical protein
LKQKRFHHCPSLSFKHYPLTQERVGQPVASASPHGLQQKLGVYNMVRNAASARTNNSNGNHAPGAPRTSMATSTNNTGHFNGPSTFRHSRTIEVKDNGEQVVIPDNCYFVAAPGAPSKQQIREGILQHVIVLVSITEQALHEASRVRVPMKCFGYQGYKHTTKAAFINSRTAQIRKTPKCGRTSTRTFRATSQQMEAGRIPKQDHSRICETNRKS